ncbi:MAG TPA: acetate/propionate family kinase [Steroidobacteraceae bacterium]|nr:acetate/propionate family kinase [Steroidobacteraceae bacterium]
MLILTLNAGSNSLKFEFVRTAQGAAKWGESVLAGAFDDIGKPEAKFSLRSGKRVVSSRRHSAGSHEEAARALFEWVDAGNAAERGVALDAIDRIAHRVVHGADEFGAPALISEEVLGRIEALEELAPLHNGPARKVIVATREWFAAAVPQYALFDTAFHRRLPDRAALYALPPQLARRHRIRRYGFHGLSHQYLTLRATQLLDRSLEGLRLITLHLEGGSSVAAIMKGHSIDTSMGFTPLEGLMMGTRSGDLDPAVPLYLMRREGWDAERTERFLNKECGLLGVSGASADTRELRDRTSEPAVALALDIFCYRVRKYIGAYLAALGGADAIVFGGGISENTALVRERICAGLEWCGAGLDPDRNAAVIDREGCISTADATLPLWVIPTEEGLMMAAEVARV